MQLAPINCEFHAIGSLQQLGYQTVNALTCSTLVSLLSL